MPLYPLPTRFKFVFFYNCASATLWFCCFLRLIILLPLVGRRFLPGGIADFFHVVSFTPLVGWVLMKAALRKKATINDLWGLANAARMVWICFGIVFPHPRVARHTTYSVLIITWCLTYFIHYTYHAFRIKTRSSPYFLFFLQYHIFFVTFPLTLIAEMALLFLSLEFVQDGLWYELLVQAFLLLYIPGAYLTWNHLLERRRSRYVEVLQKWRLARSVSSDSQAATASSSAGQAYEMADISAKNGSSSN